MRTTIAIDDDILKQIEDIAAREGRTRRDVLNDTLRRGIQSINRVDRPERFESTSKDLGRCLIPSIDDISEALAMAEGENFE